jgi:dihydroorotase
MFKHLKPILLLSAWAILFVHSVVPHLHEAKEELTVCAASHEHDEDLLDVLSHIFHFSTGVEHLENFCLESNPTIVAIPADVVGGQQDLVSFQDASYTHISPFSEEHSRYQSLRAPPVYS